MKKPYPKETELHDKYSKLSLQELTALEEFIRKSGNASLQASAKNAKHWLIKHEIVKYYMNTKI